MHSTSRDIQPNQGDQELYTIKTQVRYTHGDWRWFHSVMIFGWFTGVFSGLIFYEFAVISWWQMLKIFLIAQVVVLLIPFGYSHLKWGMHFTEWFAFSVIGAGPLLGAAFLLTAFFTAAPAVDRKERITNKSRINYEVVLQFQSGFLESQERFRTIDLNDIPMTDVRGAKYVNYSYKEGYLGLDFILNLELE